MDEARKEWKRISKELLDLGLITILDRAALAAYCQVWARWVQAERMVKESGTVTLSFKGYSMQNPHLSIANKALEQMKSFLTEFGLTPSSRTRVHAQKPQGKNEEKEKHRRFFG